MTCKGRVQRRLTACLLVPLLAAAPRALAQSATTDPGRLTFAVASVKENQNADASRFSFLPGGRFAAAGVPLRDLVRLAFAADTVQMSSQVVGPDWLATVKFDIQAQADGEITPEPDGTPSRRLRAMLRSLLQERFQVRVHMDQRPFPMYALVLERSGTLGPRLQRSTMECAGRDQPTPVTPNNGCEIKAGPGRLEARGMTMPRLARALANFPAVGRIVRDETGLSGSFDISLEFVPAFVQAPTGDGAPVANPSADAGPSLFTALKEQLGLKLDARRGNVDVVVVDRAEKPSPD